MGELSEELKEIKELLKKTEESKTEKKWNFPFFSRVRGGKAKKNWITVMKINTNGHLNIKSKQIDDQTVMVDGVPRLAANQYVMYYKRNPVIILPEWSVEPFSPAEHYNKSLISGANTKGYKILLAKMMSEGIVGKKSVPNMVKWVLGLGLAAIVGYALIRGGGR